MIGFHTFPLSVPIEALTLSEPILHRLPLPNSSTVSPLSPASTLVSLSSATATTSLHPPLIRHPYLRSPVLQLASLLFPNSASVPTLPCFDSRISFPSLLPSRGHSPLRSAHLTTSYRRRGGVPHFTASVPPSAAATAVRPAAATSLCPAASSELMP